MLVTKPDFKGRSFLCEKDFSEEELLYMIDFAANLKEMKKQGIPHHYMAGKNIALLFEKPSTRTRCSFTVACIDLGAHPEYLGKDDIQLGKKESIEDTAKVLGRMFDGIEFRGFEHSKVELLAEHSGVPVWNGLTDMWHPTQTLADFLTVKENIGHLKGVKFVYVGDGRNNVANSLLIGGAIVGMDVRICSPESLFPESSIVETARELAEKSGGRVTITADVDEAVNGADVIYTDVWVSMGEEDKFAERIALLSPYQVNMEMIRKTGNDNVIFLHCLPAFHDLETSYGRAVHEKHGLSEMEVTDEVFRSKHSKVFDQAENRMHTIKAVMALTLGDID
ncbi:ornithine carbamoyltransferase [Bacillus sp. FJAT-27916]|uniref:ornithine carbamoyltransferase n=1 Tax=Bacillus sp. FJAT-27916 TaxID=1679169 RepID=UPI000670F0FE|nr:ornithine carbamoyltransferase [Bacillus sp. FJAT-27916]KMY43241.1 ornithine carbamoyltransferase [Bacillus sp. FJAT-27916]